MTFLGTTILEVTEDSKKLLHNIALWWQKDADFVPTNIDYHITLYQAKYALEDENNIIDTYMKYISQDTLPASLKIDWLNSKWNYRGVRLKKDELLENLQDIIVMHSNRYREGRIKSTYMKDRTWYTSKENDMIDIFWYPFVYEAFVPHITLGALNDDTVDVNDCNILQLDSIHIKSLSFVIQKEWDKQIVPLYFLN